MTRGMRVALLAGMTLCFGAAAGRAEQDQEAARGEKVDGYAEWRAGNCIIADAQKVCPGPG